jgi:glycosyltransferase involved in cell wall biosynthesis
MNDILLSIVIPVYNTIEQFHKCIDSVIKQSYRNLQIILIDDGSNDGSEILCDNYAEHDSRIEVHHKKNGGLVSARKEGNRWVKGDYVIHIDSDDWIELDYIEKFVNAIRTSGASQVSSISYYRDYTNISYLNRTYIDNITSIETEDVQKYLYDKAIGKYGYNDDIPNYMWSKCVKRDLMKSVFLTLDDGIGYMEDFSFSIRCIATNSSIYFIDNPGYHYVQRETSASHVISDKDIKSLKIMRDDTLKYLCSKPYYIYTKNIPEWAYISAMCVKDFSGLQDGRSDYLVPFKDVKKGSRIVVYGMGNVGKAICNYLISSEDYNLVVSSDTRHVDDLDVRYKYVCANDINKYEYDFVVIATVKPNLINEIRANLIKAGVPDYKIRYVNGLV